VRPVDEDRIAHILEAIELIQSFETERECSTYRPAVLHEMEIIAEAVTHLSAEFQASRPEIPWKYIASLRIG
jgi:uncharacterized protein with HEPN domain